MIIGDYNSLDYWKTAHLVSCKLDELRLELEEIKVDDGGHFRREHECEQKISFLEKELIELQEDIEDANILDSSDTGYVGYEQEVGSGKGGSLFHN